MEVEESEYRRSRSGLLLPSFTATTYLSICQVMEDIGILSSYDVEYSSGRKKFIAKVTFLLTRTLYDRRSE